MKKLVQRVQAVALRFWLSESGKLGDLTWEVGAAVVVVAIIMGILTFARPTVASIWDRFVNYVTSSFGF